MHPTRQGPAGSRPLGVGPGLAAPPGSTRPGSRPGGPSRRPGQRYVPRELSARIAATNNDKAKNYGTHYRS